MITRAHRRALNRALHDLRRPLQALLLLEDGGRPAAAPPVASRRGLLELATSALHDLDGAVNGGEPGLSPRRFSCRDSLLACLERWRPQTAQAGGIRVYWDAGPAWIEGDPARLARALDNLLANAVEHGGPPVIVTGARVAGRIRITIANGVRPGRTPSRLGPATGRDDPRRGHGRDIVAEVAGAHGGRFALCQGVDGCVAALELPLADPGRAPVLAA
ncbi:MAG TPA: HAMP domain-containing sensor histidine kinase [Solirubrobacterales bacterium]|jgi:signal transduction histidine kinase